MTAQIIDGKKYSIEIIKEISMEVVKMKIKPCLAVLLVGNDSASEVYVSNKEKASKKAGFVSKLIRYAKNVTEKELLKKINEMNNDTSINGFIIQLPLPKHINQKNIIEAISPNKDADGFTTTNLGNMFVDKKCILPATARGVMYLIEKEVDKIAGKNITIVGASNIVGKPLAVLLLEKMATVTVCNIQTKNLNEHTKNADIIIVAVGKANLITKEMVKKGVIIIDVGMNQLNYGSFCGDVASDVSEIAGKITPVPGGVGPMTVAMLLKNTLDCVKMQEQ